MTSSALASPGGKALMGHRVGDEVEVMTPGGAIQYMIRDVMPLLAGQAQE